MITTPIAISVSYVNTSSFVPSTPVQRQAFLDKTNPQYTRNATLTQDSIYLRYYTSSVVIPLQSLYVVAANALAPLTWPPIILTQPTNSIVTHPTASYFSVSASAEVAISYQWYSSSLSQSISGTYSKLSDSAHGYTGSSSPLLTYLTSSVTASNSQFFVVCSDVSGQTTSSVAFLTVN
jgi:hypothetical protein